MLDHTSIIYFCDWNVSEESTFLFIYLLFWMISICFASNFSWSMGTRYILDGESTKQTSLDPHETVIDKSDNPNWATNLNWLPDSIKDFVLPAGYPGTLSNLLSDVKRFCCCSKYVSRLLASFFLQILYQMITWSICYGNCLLILPVGSVTSWLHQVC